MLHYLITSFYYKFFACADGLGFREILLPSTKKQYIKAIESYLETGESMTDPIALADYASGVSNSTRSYLAAAVTRMAQELELLAKSSATPDNIDIIQAAVFRAQALQSTIKVRQSQGERAHTWLNRFEAEKLLKSCLKRSSGKPEFKIYSMRDRLAIGLMMAAGLRREEAASIQFADVVKQNQRAVLNVRGKGAKDRVVPINKNLAEAIIDWGFLVGTKGFVLRSLGRNKEPGESISTTGIYYIIQKRGAMIGKPALQPQDLRRTYAELGRRAGVPMSDAEWDELSFSSTDQCPSPPDVQWYPDKFSGKGEIWYSINGFLGPPLGDLTGP